MDQLEISTSIGKNGAHILRLRGVLTLLTLFDFQKTVRGETAGPMILDLAELQYMDSAGLGAILGAFASCQRHNRAFGVTGASERIKTLFQVTHVDTVLPSYATLEDAEAAAGAAAKA